MLIRATASKASITTGNIAVNWLYERKKKKIKKSSSERIKCRKQHTLQHRTSSKQRKSSEKSVFVWALPLAYEEFSTMLQTVSRCRFTFQHKDWAKMSNRGFFCNEVGLCPCRTFLSDLLKEHSQNSPLIRLKFL